MKTISFIVPSRNNLSYLKWCYNSIRKNLGYGHQILLADDASTDGTWEWIKEISKSDIGVKKYRNNTGERKGIVYWYDYLCKKADNDLVMFLHADMYVCPKLDKEIIKLVKPKVVACATRVEPSLHPPGPEKITRDYGIEPEDFDEMKFLSELTSLQEDKVTNGVFAPFAILKEDYWDVGGHDKLFAPQSKEDSDIFNRLQLNGCEFKQTWKGLVYHLTSRGSRFNPMAGGAPGKDSPEWLYTTTKNMRNFIRKWGHMVKHDSMMKPIIPPKYDIGFVVKNCSYDHLANLEPWCSTMYIDNYVYKKSYIEKEQGNTLFNLDGAIKEFGAEKTNDIIVEFDATDLSPHSGTYSIIYTLSEILSNDEELEVGEFELNIFKITINDLQTYEGELIKCES